MFERLLIRGKPLLWEEAAQCYLDALPIFEASLLLEFEASPLLALVEVLPLKGLPLGCRLTLERLDPRCQIVEFYALPTEPHCPGPG